MLGTAICSTCSAGTPLHIPPPLSQPRTAPARPPCHLQLTANQLTGALPDAWAVSGVSLGQAHGLLPLFLTCAGPGGWCGSSAIMRRTFLPATTCPRLRAALHVQARKLLLGGNALTGPAFPLAWLQPGTLPTLDSLNLTGNPGLAGDLPATFPWPILFEM